ncbi:MAG: hypothetical protein KF825_08285 [Ferruginibacter sp.]|nr:hypothetical protein [Ferruginibacter sp.]
MKKDFSLLAIALLQLICFNASAKVWRVNNNLGASADFSTLSTAVSNASVVSGDTLYIEGSATSYYDANISKQLTIIGTGYFLDPADVNYPANEGLQYNKYSSVIRSINLVTGSSGCKFIGIVFAGGTIYGDNAWNNITFEKCDIADNFYVPNATNSGLTIRKCFINGITLVCNSGSLTDFTCENNIFVGFWASPNLTNLSGSNNIFRNNSFASPGIGNVMSITNCYVANNIFAQNNNTPVNFTNCNIKNNLFQQNQTLPPSAVNNQINVDISTVYVGGTTGSIDSRMMLKAGSPAIAAGVTVGAVTTPDCGAFGATDPYKLSGIPAIPTIYSLTAPTSIPSGTNTMNVTFSTRNNN